MSCSQQNLQNPRNNSVNYCLTTLSVALVYSWAGVEKVSIEEKGVTLCYTHFETTQSGKRFLIDDQNYTVVAC